MSIKVKSTAVAIATVSTVLFYSVPSQAGEYKYLYELKRTAEYVSQQEGANRYLDNLSISEKLERGKNYCESLEYLSMNEILELVEKRGNRYLEVGMRYQLAQDFYEGEASMVYASAKRLCPEYEYKIDNFASEVSEEEI